TAAFDIYTTSLHDALPIFIGHGDGLGPGDTTYKIIKKFFNSRLCQWLFARIHPNLGISIANLWSRKSRISNMKKEEKFTTEENRSEEHTSELQSREKLVCR